MADEAPASTSNTSAAEASEQASKDKNKEFDWPPLESNPDVFTSYLRSIGLSPTYAIGEVFGFDEDLLAFLPQPIHGVIVALERDRATDIQKGSEDDLSKVKFYMDQSGTLDNACGIIACIHAIFNSDPTDDEAAAAMVLPDTVLSRFRDSTLKLSPAERCAALEKTDEFKAAHRAFAMEGQSATVTSDQSKVRHHFVAFVVLDGKLVELDGTKKGPNVIGDCDDVLRGSIAEVQRRLKDGEISDKLSMMTLNVAM